MNLKKKSGGRGTGPNFYGLNRVSEAQWKKGLDFQSEKLSSVPSLVTNKSVTFLADHVSLGA